MNQYCSYFLAQIEKREIVKLISVLKSFDHLCFDRCVDKEQNIFEFFVPASMEKLFTSLMELYQQKGVVKMLRQEKNRLMKSEN